MPGHSFFLVQQCKKKKYLYILKITFVEYHLIFEMLTLDYETKNYFWMSALFYFIFFIEFTTIIVTAKWLNIKNT